MTDIDHLFKQPSKRPPTFGRLASWLFFGSSGVLLLLGFAWLQLDGTDDPSVARSAHAGVAPVGRSGRQNSADQSALKASFAVTPPSDVATASLPEKAKTVDEPLAAPMAAEYPRIFPGYLTAARLKARQNAPQWQAFRARLVANLPRVLSYSYQGSMATWISDYAAGAACEPDEAMAQNFADKAVGLMVSLSRDYQYGAELSRVYLTRGDGKTKVFALPDADLIPASVRVYVYNTVVLKVTRAADGLRDEIDSPFYSVVKVSNSSDANHDYINGIDWTVPTDVLPRYIDWLPAAGNKPAPGATYYVTAVAVLGSPISSTGWILNGQNVQFRVPPPPASAVFYEYIHGTHAADGSTLAYQQTGRGYGGLNNVMLDTTYSMRYMGKHMAMGLDWLWNSSSLTDARKAQFMDLMVRWSDYYRDNGYQSECPGSNYGAGGMVSRTLAAVALYGRDLRNGERLIREARDYRRDITVPFLQQNINVANPTTPATLKGGYWAEGWNYGALAAENLLYCGIALEHSGVISSAAPERAWASDAVRQLLIGSSDASAEKYPQQTVDTGDYYAYPAPFPGPAFINVLGAFSDNADARSYTTYLLQHRPVSKTPDPTSDDYRDLLFRDPSQQGRFWNDLPLQWRSSGCEVVCMRSDWNPDATWATTQLGSLLNAGHQAVAAGLLEVRRGIDDLLIYGPAYATGAISFQDKTAASNTLVVDDGGEGAQNYRYQQGVWPGLTGNRVIAYESSADSVYVAADLRASYSHSTNPGGGGSVDEWVRSIVYIRPGYIIVHDRCTTTRARFTKTVRWHSQFHKSSLNGSLLTVAVGKSKAFVQCYSSVPLNIALGVHTTDNKPMDEMTVAIAAPAARARYVNLIQVGSTSLKTIDFNSYIKSAKSQLEGVIVGDKQVVMFAHTPPLVLDDSYTFTAANGSMVTHRVAGLLANTPVTVHCGDAVSLARTSGQGLLTFSTTGAGLPQVVTLSK